MRKLIYILLLFPTLAFSQSVYYVQDTSENASASDANAGTDINNPWASWQKAFTTPVAGDTVWFRGGTWYPDTTLASPNGSKVVLYDPEQSLGNRGTEANPIVFKAYTGETPELNCINVTAIGTPGTNTFLQGLKIANTAFIEVNGLTVSYVKQKRDYVDISGMEFSSNISIKIINCTVHDIGGKGLFINPNWRPELYAWQSSYTYDSSFVTNCDAFACADSFPRNLSDEGFEGNSADGIKSYGTSSDSSRSTITYYGCRSWNNSDDGYDCSLEGYLIMQNCWSFWNGYLVAGDGTGFKFASSTRSANNKRLITNNISTGNESGMFILEYSGYYRSKPKIYNNFCYKDASTSYFGSTQTTYPNDSTIYRNNISYECTAQASFPYYEVHLRESNNTWNFKYDDYPGWEVNDTVTVTDADFVSLDTLQLDNARQSNGSLPVITFGHLVSGSDLIDAGIQIPTSDNIDYTIDFNGTAPDIGAFEYSAPEPSSIRIFLNSENKYYYNSEGKPIIN